MKKYLFFFILILLFFNCRNISEVEIKYLELDTTNKNSNLLNKDSKIIPGTEYNLDISAVSVENEIINNPNHKLYLIDSSNNSFKIKDIDFSYITVRSELNTFELLFTDSYRIDVYVSDNDFPGQQFNWDIDWENFNYLDYKGERGTDGISGLDGTDGEDGNPGQDGTNGEDGTNGFKGRNGTDIDCYVTAVKTDVIPDFYSEYALLFYITQTEDLIITQLRRIVLDASGGKGGDGGSGGNGGRGGNAYDYNYSNGDDGYGGDGGSGGDGGDGGNINVYYYSPDNIDIIAYLQIVSEGGTGGEGGPDGHGKSNAIGPITALLSAFAEHKGDDGSSGKNGTITTQEISKEIYLDKMSNVAEFNRFEINIDELFY
jgi:hypothetical protein